MAFSPAELWKCHGHHRNNETASKFGFVFLDAHVASALRSACANPLAGFPPCSTQKISKTAGYQPR